MAESTVLKSIITLKKIRELAEDNKAKHIDRVQQTYVMNSVRYNEGIDNANKEYENTMSEATAINGKRALDSIAEIKTKIQNIVLTPPSVELIQVIASVSARNLTEVEKQKYKDKYKNNYMDSVILAETFGEERDVTLTADYVISELATLEALVTSYFNGTLDVYNAFLLEFESEEGGKNMVDETIERMNEFIALYSDNSDK